MFIRTPHILTWIRPAVRRDANNNVTSIDTENPTFSKPIQCMFQRRPGRKVQGQDGSEYTADAILYTTAEDVQPGDQFDVTLQGHSGRYIAADVEPKYNNFGDYSHTQVPLVLDTK